MIICAPKARSSSGAVALGAPSPAAPRPRRRSPPWVSSAGGEKRGEALQGRRRSTETARKKILGEGIHKVIEHFMSTVKPYMRVERVIRDVPASESKGRVNYVVGGVNVTNAQQIVQARMKKKSVCLRTREINNNHTDVSKAKLFEHRLKPFKNNPQTPPRPSQIHPKILVFF